MGAEPSGGRITKDGAARVRPAGKAVQVAGAVASDSAIMMK